MVTQFEIDRFILKGKGASVTLSMDRWREDCCGYTEVSGVTVRQWQMVQRAHGSGREAPERSEPALCTIVLLRLGLNLKLIKDMQQHSLLTWLFTFPSPFFFFFPTPSSIHLSFNGLSAWEHKQMEGDVPPDARWSILERLQESTMEGAKEPKQCDDAAVTLPWAASRCSCAFFQIFDLACSGSY